MEAPWNDLSRDPDTLESPAWHEDVLREREERIAAGEADFVDWEQAKADIRSRASLLRSPCATMHPMSPNKQTVQTYMDAFARTDHAEILSCLTDDVEWVIPGMFHITGKDAFDKEIENDAFVGSPEICVARMTEEDDVVIAEGSVRAARSDGGVLNAVFCDVFLMKDAKIRHLTSYLMEVKAPA